MSRGHEQSHNHSKASEANSRFDAPRPAVTSKLGKKRTDELIRADGDTWQEYLAVSEKTNASTSNGSKRGGGLSSLFGKKKNKSNSVSGATNTNGNDKSKLIIRSYFQNLRTGRKVWDEPPSGASIIVPASEEMRRMAELQLGELYVATTPSSGIEDLNDRGNSANINAKTKKSSRKDSKASITTGGAAGKSSGTGARVSSGRRIRYKPDSSLNTTRSFSAAGGNRNSGKTLNDRQLQEAIERSMTERYGGVAGGNAETEEEILRRVLEESRLEAVSSSKARAKQYYDEDRNRKPPSRKHPPTNTSSGSEVTTKASRRSKISKKHL